MTLGDERVQELLTGLIRVGRVSEIGDDGRVRVTFEDRDGIESGRLQVCQGRTIGQLDASMPALEEPVLCLMLPPDQIDGFMIGSLYDSKQAPPTGDQAVRVIAGTDLRLGSVDAAYWLARGDRVLKLLQGIFDLLKTAAPQSGVGPVPFLTDVTAANAYGSGGLSAVLAIMESADDGLAGLLSDTVRTE